MPRYRLTISYDGTDFVGWQRQDAPADANPLPRPAVESPASTPARASLRSVQGIVEQAVRGAVRQPVVVMGASRTDSGVHARHQTAAFTTTDHLTSDGRRIGPPDDRLRDAINARLPEDVLVTACVRTSDEFDPIKGCLCKGYEYTVWDSPSRSLWERGRAWHQRGPLDERTMDAAARRLEGTLDFTSFAAVGHGRESAVRTVLSCRVFRDATVPERVVVRVSGDGFLWNMVRIIAGTLVDVGRGKTTPDEVSEILAALDRNRAGPTAPAHGLCLAWGLYEGDPIPAGVTLDPAWLTARTALVNERRESAAARREALARSESESGGDASP